MHFESAVEQAEAVQKRHVSRVELVRAHLERIERLNPQLNAFTDLCPRDALRRAGAADKAKAPPRSALDGAVIGVKDLNMVRGTFTRFGTPFTRYFVAPMDDVIVARLKAAGAAIVGKLATSELGTMPVTAPGKSSLRPKNGAR